MSHFISSLCCNPRVSQAALEEGSLSVRAKAAWRTEVVENVGTAEQEMGQRMCQEHGWSVEEEKDEGLEWLLTPKNRRSVTFVILKCPFGVVSAHPGTQQ